MTVVVAASDRWVIFGSIFLLLIVCALRWLIHNGCKAHQQVLHRIPTKGKRNQTKIADAPTGDGEGDLGAQTRL